MGNVQIITNNPMAKEKYPAAALLDVGVGGVFRAARDQIHVGAALIGHPLAGSIKPNESPYKSLVLSSRTGALDFKSLSLIEDARAVLEKLPAKNRRYSPKVLEDFQVIDLDLLDSAISALPAEYYL